MGSSTRIASLSLLLHSVALAASASRCSAFGFSAGRQPQHQSKIHQTHRRNFRLIPLQLDESGGNFFDDAEKAPPTQPQPQAQTQAQEKNDEPPMTLEDYEMLATPFDEHLPKINTVTLVGRVGNAPEPKYFDDGKVVLNLSLAVKRKYHPLERKVRNIRSGEEETDWFTLEFWGRDAEYVTNYVEKGSRLGVTGSLAMDGWQDKTTGEQRRKAKILVRHTDILESRAEAELRKGNKGSYNGGNYGGNGGSGGGGGKSYDQNDDDDDGGPSPAGTGGFFS